MERSAEIIIRDGSGGDRRIAVTGSVFSLGQAGDNDCVLPEGDDYHCRIELRPGGYVLVVLAGASGTTVNGTEVRESVLRGGDTIGIGSTVFVFQESGAELPVVRPASEPARRWEGGVVRQQGSVCRGCGAEFSADRVFCPSCGMRGEQGGFALAEPYVQPVETGPGTRGAGIFPMMAFFMGILGPCFLGIGWLLGIVIGFNSLSLIRRRGGLARDRTLAMWGVILGFLWPALGTPVGVLWWNNREAEKRRGEIEQQIVLNETKVIGALRGIAVTEFFAKSVLFVDRDDNGVSEYGTFEELQQLGERYGYGYFRQAVSDGKNDGYLFRIHMAGEDRFLVTAVPVTYGSTGRRTFSVGEDGVMRGEDAGGKDVSEAATRLAKLYPGEGEDLLVEYGREVARNLLTAARKEASRGDFARGRRILDELRLRFPLSPAAQDAELKAVFETIKLREADAAARQELLAALELGRSGNEAGALAKLKAAAAAYPGTAVTGEIHAEIAKIEQLLKSRMEQEAGSRFAEAEKLELDGDLDGAVEAYQQVVAVFPASGAAKKVPDVLKRVEAKKAERAASSHVALVKAVSPSEEPEKVLHALQILREQYSKTTAVADSQSLLKRREAESHAALAAQDVEAGKLEGAVSHFEKAMALAPDMAVHVKGKLGEAYLKLADACFTREDFASSLTYYDRYRKLDPGINTVPGDRYGQVCFELAGVAAGKGKPKVAKDLLSRCASWGSDRPEYYYLVGSIAAGEKEYAEAIPNFTRAIEHGPDLWQARVKRGLCLVALSKDVEGRVKSGLDAHSKNSKRGRYVVDQSSALLASMQEVQVKLRIDGDRKPRPKENPFQLKQRLSMVPVLRSRKLQEFRNSLKSIRETARQSERNREAPEGNLKMLKRMLGEALQDVGTGMRLADGGRELRAAGKALRRKYGFIVGGSNEIEQALNQEEFLETEALDSAGQGLRMFESDSRMSSVVTSVERLYGSIAVAEMDAGLAKGRKYVESSSKIIVPVDKLLASID